jgi:hypothetical protein
MSYWLDSFTGTTWDEFRRAGATISGFRETQLRNSAKVRPGDTFLCYLTGVKRWVGALEVIGPSADRRHIWSEDDYPVRFDVKPLILLDPEFGIPMESLQGQVSFFANEADRGRYKGIVRKSLNLLADQDGSCIMTLLEAADAKPTCRPVSAKQLAYEPFYRVEQRRGKHTVSTVVSVPESDEPNETSADLESPTEDPVSQHTRIQHQLLVLGSDMGFDVWVARNDRSRVCEGQQLGKLPRIISELPTQFNEATNRTIELIDVLWLRGNSIVAAFEVECTTAVYSGILRMSDLLALQPNLEIKLYLVAPDQRREKVEKELLRPTFQFREKPLHRDCGFLAVSRFTEKVDGARKLGLISALKPDFLEQTAEYFSIENGE